MGDVSAPRDHEGLYRTGNLRGDPRNLGLGGVFVFRTLDDQEGADDPVEKMLDIPSSEGWIEPGVRPSEKYRPGIVPVVSGQLYREIGFTECRHSLSDARQGDLLDEDMGRLGDDP